MSASKRGTRLGLAESADRVARDIETLIMENTYEAYLTKDARRYGDVVIAAEDSGTGEIPPGALSPDVLHAFVETREKSGLLFGDEIVRVRRWEKARVVYTVDPDVADEVLDTDWGDDVIPGDVLRRLPHPDPMVILPERIRVPSYDPDGTLLGVEEYVAFLITGTTADRRTSTVDPDCDGLILLFLGWIVDPVTGKRVTVTFAAADGSAHNAALPVGMRVEITFADLTMEQRLNYSREQITSAGPALRAGFRDAMHASRVVADLTARGLALTVFLVTTDVEVSTRKVSGGPGARGRRKKTGPTEGSVTTVVEVGQRLGARLRAHAADTRARRPGTGTGRTVTPHVRRAHYRRVWVGPRSDPTQRHQEPRWIPPSFVNATGTDPTVTQVHTP